MKRLKHVTETSSSDKDGEILTTSKTFAVKTQTTEEFYLTFFSFMQPHLKIKNMIDINVLTKMCMMMEYDSTEVMLPTQRRKTMCEELGMESTHLSNSFKRLRELGLIQGDSGVYEINPYYVWKGRTDAREKLLREKGIEIRLKFLGKGYDDIEEALNPFKGGNTKFDNEKESIS